MNHFVLKNHPRPKVVFCVRKAQFSSYFEFLISQFLLAGYEIHLFSPDPQEVHKLDFLKRAFDSDLLVLHTMRLGRNKFFRRFIWELRELRSVRKYLLDAGQSAFYLQRWKSYLSWPLRKLLDFQWTQKILKSNTVDLILSAVEVLTPADSEVHRSLKEIRPQLVIATPGNMKHSNEIEFVKAAKKLNIFSIIPVISWDNLTTKGIFVVKPDLLLVWNQKQVEFALSKHEFLEPEVKVVGACLFDKWWLPEIKTAKAKMNMVQPYVLYLGSSSNIAPDETEIILELKKGLPDYCICVRPHPENRRHYDKLLKQEGVFVYAEENVFPSSAKTQLEFGAMLNGAEAVVGVNTSAMIDAVIMDKPTIAIALKKFESTQMKTLHFKDLVESSAVYLSSSVAETISCIKTLEAQDELKVKRLQFVKDFIRPKGLNQFAGEVAFKEICYYLESKS